MRDTLAASMACLTASIRSWTGIPLSVTRTDSSLGPSDYLVVRLPDCCCWVSVDRVRQPGRIACVPGYRPPRLMRGRAQRLSVDHEGTVEGVGERASGTGTDRP